jgi:hypothetical protein
VQLGPRVCPGFHFADLRFGLPHIKDLTKEESDFHHEGREGHVRFVGRSHHLVNGLSWIDDQEFRKPQKF